MPTTANQIVVVNVTQTVAPTPNKLQQTGCIVTRGGTLTAAGTVSLIVAQSNLSAILDSGGNPSAAAELQAAYTTFSANNNAGRAVYVLELGIDASAGYLTGIPLPLANKSMAVWREITAGSFTVTINGVNIMPTGLDFSAANSLVDVAAIITASLGGNFVTWNGAQFVITSSLVGNLSSVLNVTTAEGGTDISVLSGLAAISGSIPTAGYDAGVAAGISQLGTFIDNNPKKYYAYLCPNGWDADPIFVNFVGNFTGTGSEVYFYFNASKATYAAYIGRKSAVVVIPSPNAPTTEFTAAAWFAGVLQYNPSATNQVTPFAFKFLFGVTPYPETNPADLVNFKDGFANFVATGAEGGISNTIVKWGKTADGRPIAYWYAVDWAQINLQLDIANSVINGSQNPQNPLYYNQNGINRLKASAQQTMARQISFGMALSPVTVNAIDFLTYSAQNPSHYALGIYNGIGITFTPQGGFESITFNVNATDFVAG